MDQDKIKKSLDLFGNIDTFNKNMFLSTSGIGVGLSSSYKLAKGLGGTLELTSAKKVGTSVKVIVKAYCEDRDHRNRYDQNNLSSEEDSVNEENGNSFNLFNKSAFNIKAAR